VADLADLFHRLSSGIYVIGVAEGDRRNAFTAAWVTQVSFDPLLVALSVNTEHASWPILAGGGGFTVNVLAKEQIELARHFGTQSARETDKLGAVAWHAGRLGPPILDDALAYIECRLVEIVPAGKYRIAIGGPVAGEILRPDATPLLYADTGQLDGSRELFPRSFG
jgi:flavin reductase (DIM6/NTAB) family NADH-FMN oxidoreductase RutF